MGKYDDIILLPHPISKKRRPMAMRERAAQFAPFAALKGHEQAIEDTARAAMEHDPTYTIEEDPAYMKDIDWEG